MALGPVGFQQLKGAPIICTRVTRADFVVPRPVGVKQSQPLLSVAYDVVRLYLEL